MPIKPINFAINVSINVGENLLIDAGRLFKNVGYDVVIMWAMML